MSKSAVVTTDYKSSCTQISRCELLHFGTDEFNKFFFSKIFVLKIEIYIK